MQKLNRIRLQTLLTTNVCEIVFVRRSPERAPGKAPTRRMLCCNSMDLLNSINGKLSLNFHLPNGPKQLDEAKHNIVVVWDIFMQDYRNVSTDNVYLVKKIPADDTFWEYYNKNLLQMSAEEKMQFMDTL